jgi:cytoskeleton protein RodZ
MSEVAVTLGQRLKVERERKGLSAAKAADELHLDAWVVDALESDDYARVGPSVYVKGHLKRYAEILGLPPAEILAAYEAPPAAAPAPAASMRLRTSAPTGSGLPWLAIAGSALAAVFIGGLVWWKPWHAGANTAGSAASAQSSAGAASSANDGAQPDPATSDEAADGATLATSGGAAGGDGAPDAAAAPRAGSPGAALASRGSGAAGAAGAAGKAGAALSAGASGAAAASGAVGGTAPSPGRQAAAGPQGDGDVAAGAGRARLRLSFSADSWVDVRDAAGQRVFAGNGRANTVRTLAGTAPLRVYLRAANGVQLEINNHAVAIGPQYVVGNVAHFEAGADGVLRRDTSRPPRPRG